MSFNLIRNSRVFFTTNVNADTGVVAATGFLPTNTCEIQVLDGFSFSQATNNETVTLNEAGATPVRGQRSFNTSLEPVDFSFTTYMRPADGGTNITAEEGVLWNALLGTGAIGGGGAAWTETTTKATVVATNSNAHQLQKFGLVIIVDSVSYIVDNCVLDSAAIDFGLDAIANIAWNGKGRTLRQIEGLTANTASPVVFGGGITGSAKPKNATAPYIANKLSTMQVKKAIGGTGTAFNVALTGGSLTISNNVTYLTPANIGVVNQPATYFTGTRSVSGNVTAYLRAGATNTAGLLADLLASSTTDTDPEFFLQIEVGGLANATRVEFKMPATVLSIPSVSTEQVVSTEISFTAQGSTGSAFDIASANELEVNYYTTNGA